MTIRRTMEELEELYLHPRAARSANSLGREADEPPCDIRTSFQRDRDRILHSKAFRRLKHKTQVFIAPEGDHYRTRLTHTLEVSQISRTIARALRLNEDLTEAVALGHDLGHTPFGHAGEAALDQVSETGFKHNEQSLRVVEILESIPGVQGRQGVRGPGVRGLNLTREVRDGILHHTGSGMPSTLEGRIVRIADRVAYLNHDVDDAIRGGILREDDLPEETRLLGEDHSSRIDFLVRDLIESSQDLDDIRQSPAAAGAMTTLREFMFAQVYIGSRAKAEEGKARFILAQLYQYYREHPDSVPGSFAPNRNDGPARTACDYVAGMTDRFCIAEFTRHFLPSPWAGLEEMEVKARSIEKP